MATKPAKYFWDRLIEFITTPMYEPPEVWSEVSKIKPSWRDKVVIKE